MDIWNDRRPVVADDHEWDQLNQTPLDVRAANARLRGAAPDHRKDEVNRQIRTASVQRHRARRAGRDDYSSMGEYLSFMTGADE